MNQIPTRELYEVCLKVYCYFVRRALTFELLLPLSSAGETMLLSRSFAISFLAGLATATTSDEHHPACDAVKAKISSASKVYYPGEYNYPLRQLGELTYVQATPYTPQGSRIISHPTKKILCV